MNTLPAAIVTLSILASLLDSNPAPITQGKMAQLLVDLEIAQAALAHDTTNKGKGAELSSKDLVAILHRHAISPILFRTSYQYYLQHPKVLSEIYQEVVYRISILTKSKDHVQG